MVIVLDGLAVKVALQQTAPAQIFLRSNLLFPLERRMGLGYKICRGYMDTKTTFFVGRVFLPCLNDLIHKIGNSENILICFRRQTQHEIELDVTPATLKGLGAGIQDLILGQILVDYIPQTLSTGFRRKGKAALADGLKLFHQFPGEIIRPQRRHGKVDTVFGAVRNHLIGQFLQATVIRGGQAGQRDLVMAGILHGLHCLTVENLRALFSHRAAGEAGLAEPAAPDTASENLKVRTVMDYLRRGNDHLGGPVSIIQILNDPLGNLFRSTIQRVNRSQRSILVIFMPVERGHIHTGNFRNLRQELFLAPAFYLCPIIQGNDLNGTLLAFTQREEVKEVCQRFRIEGTDTTGKHDALQIMAILCVERNSRQVHHVEHIGIGHLIADGEGDHVKITDGFLTFKAPKRKIMLTHGFFHVPPGGKDPLAPHAVHFIHDAVKDPHAHIGHTNLIGIREAERNPNPYILRILPDFIVFSAGVSGRLLYPRQNSL